MPVNPTSYRSSAASRGTAHIYIDNSNLWIQGQRTYAEKKKFEVKHDPTWRFDVGRLKQILLAKLEPKAGETAFDSTVNLYGSTPPPVDTVWRAIESHNVKVSTFARSSWTGREKQVDAEIIADSVGEAAKAFFLKIPSTFIIVSGDRDLLTAANKIHGEYQCPVHVWSWKNGLANMYKQQQLVHVHFLDDYLEKIGFRETTFRIDRNDIHPHSIVVLDPLPKADMIKKFILGLDTPVYRYVYKHQRPEASSKDLVIIPAFARRMTYKELESFYMAGKTQLELDGLKVLAYQEYLGSGTSGRVELEVSNRFSEFPEGEFSDGEIVGGNEHNDRQEVVVKNDDDDDDDGWTDVNRRSEKRRKHLKNEERKLRLRCDWRLYCTKEDRCRYGHTKAEEERFKAYGHLNATKHKKCQNDGCLRKSKCTYAHSDAELFCPTCDRRGAGHAMVDCPESDRNKRQG